MPECLRKEFSPDPGFVDRTRSIFLESYRQCYGVSHKRAVSIFPKLATGILSLAVLFGGLTAYARVADVEPSHPLYALKRQSETFQVMLAKTEDKPQLHAEFAKQRAQEIEQLRGKESDKGESAAIQKLAESMTSEAEKSVQNMKVLEKQGIPEVKTATACESLKDLISRDTSEIKGMLKAKPHLETNVQKLCAGEKENKKDGATLEEEEKVPKKEMIEEHGKGETRGKSD